MEGTAMDTVYDWVTVAIFAGLVVLFLQRSVGQDHDPMWPYFAAAIGCMTTNWIGNQAVENGNFAWHATAVAGLIAILAFVQHFLNPFGKNRE